MDGRGGWDGAGREQGGAERDELGGTTSVRAFRGKNRLGPWSGGFTGS